MDVLRLLKLKVSPGDVSDLMTEIRDLIDSLYPLSREASPVKQPQNPTRDVATSAQWVTFEFGGLFEWL